MTKIPLDETTLAKLRDIKERIEVCDEQGRIVGYFEPSIYAGIVIPDFTEEALQAAENDPVTYSLDEVWESIRRGEVV